MTIDKNKELKVILLYPPNLLVPSFAKKAVLPIGIAYLAAVLKNNHLHVDVVDCVIEGIEKDFSFNGTNYYGLDLQEIKQRISEGSYDVVGVSCQFTALLEICIEICRIAKECNVPNVIVGGPHASARPESLLSSKVVDYVCVGEGEKVIKEFTDCLKKDDLPGIKRLDGIAYPENGEVHLPSTISFIEDIDTIPFPAREMFPIEKYFSKSSPMGGFFKSNKNLTILSSRGCPARCNFCASTRFWGKKVRYRSVQNTLDEIKELKSKHGVEEIQFADDNLTLNKKRALKLFSEMKKNEYSCPWSVPSGVALWAIDREIIDAMKDAGCHYVALAIESGNQRVLTEVINKPTKLDKVPEICSYFREKKITIGAFFVIGFPDEKLEEIRDSFKFASKCNLDNANFFFATPLPGSPLWDQAVRENLFIDGFNLKDIKYDRPSLKSRNWTIQELMDVVQYSKMRFYLHTFLRHPRVLLFRIFEMLKKDPRRLFSVIYNQVFSRKVKGN